MIIVVYCTSSQPLNYNLIFILSNSAGICFSSQAKVIHIVFNFLAVCFQVMILMMDHLLEFTILNVIIYNTTMVFGWSTWARMCSILYLYDKGKKFLAYYLCWKCVISPWQFLIIFQILYEKWKMNWKNLVLLFVRLIFSLSLWSSLVKIFLFINQLVWNLILFLSPFLFSILF